MKFERFRELWEALVTNRPKSASGGVPITNGMSERTAEALIEYADGKKDKLQAVRKFLDSNPAPVID